MNFFSSILYFNQNINKTKSLDNKHNMVSDIGHKSKKIPYIVWIKAPIFLQALINTMEATPHS